MPKIAVSSFIASFLTSPLRRWAELEPWTLAADAPRIISALLGEIAGGEYQIHDSVAVHRSAVVESGAILKGPCIVGANCFVASGAYLRGGTWLDAGCSLGPGVELKSSFMFRGAKLAHFNFVGDSILGADVNFEAGSIIANYRNERADKQIVIRRGNEIITTGVEKFGAIIGDGCRVGANAVLAPGTLLEPRTVIQRLALVDQDASSSFS